MSWRTPGTRRTRQDLHAPSSLSSSTPGRRRGARIPTVAMAVTVRRAARTRCGCCAGLETRPRRGASCTRSPPPTIAATKTRSCWRRWRRSPPLPCMAGFRSSLLPSCRATRRQLSIFSVDFASRRSLGLTERGVPLCAMPRAPPALRCRRLWAPTRARIRQPTHRRRRLPRSDTSAERIGEPQCPRNPLSVRPHLALRVGRGGRGGGSA